MKNIVTITLVVLVILLIGVFVKNSMNGGTDKLPTYLPPTIETTENLTLFKSNVVPAAKTVNIGPSQAEEETFDVIATQGQYLNEERKLALTISIEEIKPDRYTIYKDKVWQRYTAPSRGGTTTQYTDRDHDVYLSFRELTQEDDTSDMVIMGGGYVFIPEEDVAITFSLYNPRLNACEDILKADTCTYAAEKQLPTIDDAKKIAQRLLTQYLGEEK